MVGLGGHDDAVRPKHVPRPPHRLVGGVARMVYVHVLARHAQFNAVRLHSIGLVIVGGAVVAADDDGPGRTALVQVAGHFQPIGQNVARRAVGVHAGPQHHHGIGGIAGQGPRRAFHGNYPIARRGHRGHGDHVGHAHDEHRQRADGQQHASAPAPPGHGSGVVAGHRPPPS